ncbi:hypothetical protein STVIR_7719 [Streptomyces viridochromogenes Tue57]|uniref:Uncharacterized protein n=1 Tax=Streptomyces viridochromogenes Tue57 TaxID=1160705 RepID=L8P4C0_STRVR|nr:hypothetical protein STVIR_7719 [Streptomyces viridochromogenes Tue57]
MRRTTRTPSTTNQDESHPKRKPSKAGRRKSPAAHPSQR